MSTLPLPIDRITAKERAKDIMAEARSAGRKLTYTQALAEVAKRHGYANVHQMTASYRDALPETPKFEPTIVNSLEAALARGKGGVVMIHRLPGTGVLSCVVDAYSKGACVELRASMIDVERLQIDSHFTDRVRKAEAVIIDLIDQVSTDVAKRLLSGLKDEPRTIAGVQVPDGATIILMTTSPAPRLMAYLTGVRNRVIVPQDPATNPDAPKYSFRFEGPSATGKTLVAKALADMAARCENISIAGVHTDSDIPGSTVYSMPTSNIIRRRPGSWLWMQAILGEAGDRTKADGGDAETFRGHVQSLVGQHLKNALLGLGVWEALQIVANLPTDDWKALFNHAMDFLIEANFSSPSYGLDPDGLKTYSDDIGGGLQKIFRGDRSPDAKPVFIEFNDGPAEPPLNDKLRKIAEDYTFKPVILQPVKKKD